ncbi:PilW family protein, partial [Accumulibacter sp.]|uniref:PilW family protein n=1 Tax=Accumulibacter sp. TaxID=2053492 RepID=UPI00391D556E
MRPSIPPAVARFAGFGLIEILVSMVIGLVTFLVIAQVFAGFESSKRTTMFGVDAQVGGLLA